MKILIIEDEIRQLMAILIDNAIKNTGEGGRININTVQEKGNAVLTVTNTGEGIAEEHIAHIFERFYTQDPAHREESFGLGLSIAKAIVSRHGGTITAGSIQGEETRFTVSIRKMEK
ncbi:MAG: sensor histidine kinase [Firmicutes bacterium]|nr:sensor histidine kinase [Bacillota bacterium]MDY5607029.1 sensor histidine kinase [Lentihominibacter sp.]